MNKDYSGYDYVMQSYDYVTQDSVIDFAEKGAVDNIGIVTGGSNYRVGDVVVFDKDIDYAFKATAKVTKATGTPISEISVSQTTISNIAFYPTATGNQIVGVASTAIGLQNNTLVKICLLYTSDAADE